MLKRYRGTLIVTMLVLLLPMAVGLLLWNALPEQVPTHFNAAGEADGWSSRGFAVFGLPAVLMAIHWGCALVSLKMDPKAENLQGKMMSLVLWICPAMAILMMALVYGNAMGLDWPAEVLTPLALGLMMAVIGNWLPKCRQSYTLGIKLPWTLADEDNWNRTHRFAGPIWVAGGLVMIATALLGGQLLWLLVPVLLAMVIAPTVYSYLLYRSKYKG